MLTLFLIIALTSFKIILSVENNDTKFINSLPENEKKEFLLKVERRIQNEVPEVKSPELNDTNVEAYEKRLEDQGKSIQNILRMEIDSLKTSNRRNTNSTDRLDDPHIDLTFKTQTEKPKASRRRNEGNGLGKNVENIPVVVQYDSKYVNTYNGSSRNSSVPQNKNEKVEPDLKVYKTELKVDEPENVSLSAKSVGVNASSIEPKRMGRRSNNIDKMHEEFDNTTVGNPDNSGNFSLDKNTSDNVKSSNITKVELGKSTVLDSDNSGKENVTLDVTIENDPVINQTNSNSTPNNILANSGDNIETTTQFNENTQTDGSKLHILRTINDSVNATIDDVESSTSTTTKMSDVNTGESSTVNSFTIMANNVGSTETSSVNGVTRLDYETAGPDPNNSNSDLLSKDDSEKQPHYVPVHNYDPENAYYNANSQHHSSYNADNTSDIIQIKERHSKTTNFDIYTNKNKKSLRIMDVKERIISNGKSKQNSDLYDLLTSDKFDQSSEDDVVFEKPLKHTLNKIRTNLYQNELNKKSKSYVNNADIYLTEEETMADDDSTTKKDKYKMQIGNITELVTKFGVILRNLLKKAYKNDKSALESKQKSYKDLDDIVNIFLKDIVNSLDHNKGIAKKKDAMQKIQIGVDKNNLKPSKDKLSNKELQSRFHIKGRNENYEHKKNKIHSSFDDDINEAPHAFEKPDNQIEKSTTQINDEYLKIHINILKDLVNRNDKGLETYDWLGTTVLIRAGLAKLQDITEKKIKHQKLLPLDQQLLDFVIELFETSKELTANQDEPSVSSRRKAKGQRVTFHIPRPKNGKKFNSLNRMYTELKNARTAGHRRSRLSFVDFKEALDCLEMCLDEFHNAIKHISSITTYKKQRWYKNIKQVFLKSAKDKEYMQVLLHLVTARLVRLIDDAAKNLDSLEDNLMKDKVAVDRIQVEFMLLIRICNQL